MLHHERVIPPTHIYPSDEWNIVEKKYHPPFLEMTETIFSTGNGYLGMRGGFEEGAPGVQNGTFVNGFYETWPIVYGEEAYGFAKTGQTMVNVTDCKKIKIYVDDEPFYLPTANILSYDRRLNMKAATLDREVLWETSAGKQVLIKSRRLVSFQQRHLAAISYEVTVLNGEAPVVLSSEMLYLPNHQKGKGDPRLGKGSIERILHPRKQGVKERRVILCHETKQSKGILACGIDHDLLTECPHSYKSKCSEDFGAVVFSIEAKPGKVIRLFKYMTYHTTYTASPEGLYDRADRALDRAQRQGFTRLLTEQEQYMEEFWERSDIKVRDMDPAFTQRSTLEFQQAIRFNLFHIIQAAGRADTTGVPAKGLTGEAYEGQYFWDTEIYLLPFLIYTSPHIAKNLLMFRYRMLDKARQRARELNQKGAMFPWRTINGEEASAFYAAGTAQYHINADIVYALRKYVQATGDMEFLYEYGAEILVETARFWSDLGFFSPQKGGRFCIHGVTGPDEYNTVVNNNTYTNLMAEENLRYAAETMQSMRVTQPERFAGLVNMTGLDMDEVAMWDKAAESMYVPFDQKLGIHPQDDFFLEKEVWDFKNTPREHYPLLLFFHPLVIYRYQVIKQADIVLAMFLMGKDFSPERKKRNFDYYDPLTTGDSSLSSCIQSIVAAEIGYAKTAMEYARAALLMDLADVGGNVKDGCHIASMGGTWMVMVYGMAGMRDEDGILTFRPRSAPDHSPVISFPLTYHKQILDVEIGKDRATYSLRKGEGFMFRHEDEEITLSPTTSVVSRTIISPKIP